MPDVRTFMLAYVHDFSPFLWQFNEKFGIRWYGVAYLVAFVLGFYVYRSLARRGYSDLEPEHQVGDFITGCAIFGVMLGGRLGFMFFYNWDTLIHHPLILFKVWDGGMSAHGGMIGVALFSLWYAWRHKVSWLNLGDNIVVITPIGLFLGRLANFINGELYGRITNPPVAWAMQFPNELLEAPVEMQTAARKAAFTINPQWTEVQDVIENARHSPELREQLAGILSPRHPSQFYEAALEGVLLFFIMWILRTKFRLPNGVLTGIFFIGYAILRSFVEFFREPDAPLTGSLTRGQVLSIGIGIAGVGFLIAAYVRPRYPQPKR